MWIIVIGLTAVVLMLARKSPGNQNDTTTSIGPDLSIPALGASGVPSPATSNGSPTIAIPNGIRLESTYRMAKPLDKVLANQVPAVSWRNRLSVQAQGSEWLTDASSSLKTQDVPALTHQTSNVGLTKI